MLLDSIDHAIRVRRAAWKWKESVICIVRYTQNDDGAKNVNKLTVARTKMEVGKSGTRVAQ